MFVFCTQLLPFVGEELTTVQVEPCSPAVAKERKEVLEVCSTSTPLVCAGVDPKNLLDK